MTSRIQKSPASKRFRGHCRAVRLPNPEFPRWATPPTGRRRRCRHTQGRSGRFLGRAWDKCRPSWGWSLGPVRHPFVIPWLTIVGVVIAVPLTAGLIAAAVSRRPPAAQLLRPISRTIDCGRVDQGHGALLGASSLLRDTPFGSRRSASTDSVSGVQSTLTTYCRYGNMLSTRIGAR
jgi:hypothetical protein